MNDDVMARARPARRARGWGSLVALLVGVALLAAACGGGDDETKAATPSPTTKDGKLAPLPDNTCSLLSNEAVEKATDKEVGDARPTPLQCAYVAPDGKSLVASILVQRGTQAVIDFDDLAHTRDVEEVDLDGADRGAFSAPFYALAALKEASKTHILVQVPALKGKSDEKIKEADQELMEIVLSKV